MQRRPLRFLPIVSVLFALGTSACDQSTAPDESDELGFEDEEDDLRGYSEFPEDFDPTALPELATEVVARVNVDGSEILFIAREPLAGEGADFIIDMAETGARDAEAVIEPLLDQDASPLEILLQLDPDHEIHEALRLDHERVAQEQGRDSAEVRQYFTFRDGSSVVHDADRCGVKGTSSWFAFAEYMADIANGGQLELKSTILNDSTPMSARSILMTAHENSGDNVAVRVCNPRISEWGGCADDRFQTYVVTYGPAGSGTPWSGKVIDCDLLKYWFGKQVDGQNYGIIVSDAERRFGVHWTPCDYGLPCSSRNAYLGMAIK